MNGSFQGIYGENGSIVYPQSYGYAAYPYSPATSPGPQVGGDGQLYAAQQQYQYPAFFPTGAFASSVTTATQGDLSANKAGGVKTAETKNVASAAGKGSNGTVTGKPNNQTTHNTASNLYGTGAPGGGFAGGYGYDGFYAPVPCYDGSKYSDVQRSGSGVASSYSKSTTVPSSRNQNYRSNSHYTV